LTEFILAANLLTGAFSTNQLTNINKYININ